LQDGDVLEVQVVHEETLRAAHVSVQGAVWHSADIRLTEGMTVEDLLRAGGGPLPEAYLPRAEILRRTGPASSRVIPIDLRERPATFPLQPEDVLRVSTAKEAIYRAPSVTIRGDVQREGAYERTDGMRLRDLLFEAGGPTRDQAFLQIEVARAVGAETVTFTPEVTPLLAGDIKQDMELADGDVVYVRTLGDYRHTPREVLIQGEVRWPGFSPLQGDTQSLSSMLEKVGGLKPEAFVEGVVLLRRVEELVNAHAAAHASDIYHSNDDARKRDEILRFFKVGQGDALAKLPDTVTVLPTDNVSNSLIDPFLAGEDRERLQKELDTTIKAQQGVTGATPPTTQPQTLSHYLRVAIDVQDVLTHKTDLDLRPNDILLVPPVPQMILVEGEVKSNTARPFVEKHTVGDYLRSAGGLKPSADRRQILIVRADGNVDSASPRTVVKRGDIILVQRAPAAVPVDKTEELAEYAAIGSILSGLFTTAVAIKNF
jgi:protein involved in polysaccharide export with SLBB domain